MNKKTTIFWHRRDLRIEDNCGLFSALKSEYPVQPIFIFDSNILEKLPENDARVAFIHQELVELQKKYIERETTLDVRIGDPLDVWKQLADDYNIGLVYANRDYEPYALERDKAIYELLKEKGIDFKGKKDHVIFEKDEITKKDGKPYTVYTPYSKIWKANFTEKQTVAYPSNQINHWNKVEPRVVPSLTEVGFVKREIDFPSREINKEIVKKYHTTRDILSQIGTSRLSLHLRFGTISIRQLIRETKDLNEKYLNELIWRDFYQQILWHFPEVIHHNFNRKYDGVEWRRSEDDFKKWCEGKTGYPIVDAGMRELNQTGYMHNRVRMITASFLTKHLLIDWRWGEAYFAKKLLDFELASNNGGWQWAAGTGVDAAPYFRIFNPYMQTEKFDKNMVYIKRWVPEVHKNSYPKPIIEHKIARERALSTYKVGLERV